MNIVEQSLDPSLDPVLGPGVDSLRKRYLYKVATSLAGFFAGFFTSALIPRALGPSLYGDYNFVVGVFTQLLAFLNMGSQHWFFSRIAQKKKTADITAFYSVVVFIILAILSLAVSVIAFTPLREKLLPGQGLSIIFLALFYFYFSFIVDVLSGMVDAFGLTVRFEKVKIAVKFAGALAIFLFFQFELLNLTTFFLYQYAIFFISLIALFFILASSGKFFDFRVHLTTATMKFHFRDFWLFSMPMLLYSTINAFEGVADRWMLQAYGGSIQQGYYSFGYNFNVIFYFILGAIQPLLMREFSLAFSKKDDNRLIELIRRFGPILFAGMAYFSCFVAVNSSFITSFFGGVSFQGSENIFSMLSFYPIFSVYSVLTITFFLATGKSRLLMKLSFISVPAGILTSFFLMAPASLSGGHQGASGLAFKIVTAEFIFSNLRLLLMLKSLKSGYLWYIGNQISTLLLFTSSALLIRIFIIARLPVHSDILLFLFSGFFYSIAILLILLLFPGLAGLHRKEISGNLYKVFSLFKKENEL